jgi:succinate dehydrogenase/fumarate reductase flavoprotein subunit
LQKFDDAAALAKHFEMDPVQLEKTLKEYNDMFVESKTDEHAKDRFDKKVFPGEVDAKGTIYAALITPAIHYTMGGLKIDKQVRRDFSGRGLANPLENSCVG